MAEDVRVFPLEPNLWLVESDFDWNGTKISANSLILTSTDAALAIDTPWTEEQTGRLLDWIDTEIGLPVRILVITHAHNDRIGGIAEFHERGVISYGFEGSVPLARSQGYEVPQITFAERLEIGFGEETVSLLYPGPGHVTDNIVVLLEDRQVLYGGCFIKNLGSRGLGYTGDADLEAWPRSLARLRELVPSPTVVIPGHGDKGGADLIDHTESLLEGHDPTSPR